MELLSKKREQIKFLKDLVLNPNGECDITVASLISGGIQDFL